jgi:hypothetical protein
MREVRKFACSALRIANEMGSHMIRYHKLKKKMGKAEFI